MSNKPVTIPNTFASATSAIPLSQLDADFTSLANVTNDLITYSNYVADTGVADAYIANFSSGINTTTLTAGLLVQFKAGNANTGTSTLAVKVNGTAVGTATIKYADGTNLAAGAIAAGAIVTVQYDGTNFQLMNDPAGKSGGDVTGPSSATNNGIALFDGTTGKLIKDSASSDGLIYGITVGRGGGAVASNTAVGGNAGGANTTGTENTFVGYNSGYTNTTGSYNSSFGRAALFLNNGSSNTGIGHNSLLNNSSGSYNTALGDASLYSNTTGANNTAVGYQAGYANTTSQFNTYVGTYSGTNLTGANNTGLGYGSLTSAGSATGANNTGIGYTSLNSLSSGSFNTAIGSGSLQANTTASNNTAVGYQSLYANTTGTQNTAVGNALNANTTGSYNSAFGNGALASNTTASYNNAFGANDNAKGPALVSNTTGTNNNAFGNGALATNSTGSYNSAFGHSALASNTTASSNTAVGYQSGYSTTTAGANTFIGYQSGYTNSTGLYNVYLGYLSGYTATGSYNTFLGIQAGQLTTTGTVSCYVGAGAGSQITTGSKNTILGSYNGNQGGLDIRTASNYIVLSDGDGNPRGWFDGNGQLNIKSGNSGYSVNQENTSSLGLGFNSSLYSDNTSYAYFTGYSTFSNAIRVRIWSNGNIQNTNNSYGALSDIKLKENITDATPKLQDLCKVKVRNYNLIGEETKQIGVVAQELEEIFPSMIDVTNDTDKDGNDLGTTTKAVKYSVFVPMLIKAIQEQQAIIENLTTRLTALENK